MRIQEENVESIESSGVAKGGAGRLLPFDKIASLGYLVRIELSTQLKPSTIGKI